MERKNWMYRQSNMRRSQRGAALIFALVAVIVISILTLATGRLIGGHLALEQQAEGYSRAINIAEAAANWQLNRMSRSKLPGDNSNIPGRLSYEAVNTWGDAPSGGPEPYDGALPTADLGTAFAGNATVWVRSVAGGKWTPPQFAQIYALGQDPMTGIRRGVKFGAQPVGISDQYALFAQNELHFDSTPTEAGADAGATQLLSGYIGSNTRVSSRDGAPTPTGSSLYFGCRLGPNATLAPTGATWGASWDFPRLSDPVRLPTIEQMINFMYRGRTVADCATQNDNAQIDYMSSETGDFSLLRESNGSPITELTSTQFNRTALYQGQYHVIRLRISETAPSGNLFRFSRIRMRPTDVLVLDLRRTYPNAMGPQHSIRILIDNNGASDTVVTNLAYFNSFLPVRTAGDANPETQSYFWYNNTRGTFKYQPNMSANAEFILSDSANPIWKLQVEPTLRGAVYGINDLNASNNEAGDIKIYGKTGLNVKVQSAVGNHVTLLGPVQVEWKTAEDFNNPNMYVLYYTINSRLFGEMSTAIDPFSVNTLGLPASPVYDYGE